METLRIAQISTPFERTPPSRYGGTEGVASYLTEGLVKRGHEVTLFGTGDSVTDADLRWLFPKPVRPYSRHDELVHTTFAFSFADEFDIIHNHSSFSGIALCSLIKTPSVTTLHGDFNKEELFFFRAFKDNNYIAISESQRKRFPDINFLDVVYNSIDVDSFPFASKKNGYFLYIGLMAAHKGPHHAIEVVKRVNGPLRLAGKVDQEYIQFFERDVKPALNHQIQFFGEISDSTKKRFYQDAKCLLFPSTWEEPFGLVMIEAMACGTPVVAFDRGAVPEIVVDGKTGFVVQDVDEMVDAVERINEIDPYFCRKHIEKKFDIDQMVKNYEKIYRKCS